MAPNENPEAEALTTSEIELTTDARIPDSEDEKAIAEFYQSFEYVMVFPLFDDEEGTPFSGEKEGVQTKEAKA